MKGKLSKSDIQYRLHNEEGIIIATSYDGKLSIQNCDEIFGVFDVEKLAEECAETSHTTDELYEKGLFYGFMSGFNKAMSLNKDKLFSEDQMWEMFIFGESFKRKIKLENIENKPMGEIFNDKIKSLRQPAEIDVEVEMEYVGECNGNNGDGCFQDSPAHNCGCFQRVSKLDHNGCLILKKI